jgi:hypothetical protein
MADLANVLSCCSGLVDALKTGGKGHGPRALIQESQAVLSGVAAMSFNACASSRASSEGVDAEYRAHDLIGRTAQTDERAVGGATHEARITGAG